MPPVNRRQPFRGETVQPGVKRQRAVPCVNFELSRSVDQRLLNNVGCVNAGRQPGIEPHFDHATQPRPVAIEKPFDRFGIASRGAAEQVIGIVQSSGVW